MQLHKNHDLKLQSLKPFTRSAYHAIAATTKKWEAKGARAYADEAKHADYQLHDQEHQQHIIKGTWDGITRPSFVISIDPMMIADPGHGIKRRWGVKSLR